MPYPSSTQQEARPTYIWGQCWVTLAVIFERLADEVYTAIELVEKVETLCCHCVQGFCGTHLAGIAICSGIHLPV